MCILYIYIPQDFIHSSPWSSTLYTSRYKDEDKIEGKSNFFAPIKTLSPTLFEGAHPPLALPHYPFIVSIGRILVGTRYNGGNTWLRSCVAGASDRIFSKILNGHRTRVGCWCRRHPMRDYACVRLCMCVHCII
jgi:hypothetical protein